MNKTIKYLSVLLLNGLAISLILTVLGVFQADYSIKQKEDSYLIGASYMTMNNEFYKIISEQIKAKIEANGDRWILRDPALDQDRQIKQIEEMIQEGIDVLVLTPVKWDGLSDVLLKAKEKGIKIVVVDSDIADSDIPDCTIASDNYLAGEIIGQYFLQNVEEGEVVLMTHESAKSGRDRIDGFVETVSQNENIHIVERIDCEGQVEIAMPKILELIDSGVYFDEVFCLNDLTSVGVIAALKNRGLIDNVGVYGIDASPDSKKLVKEGLLKGTAAQFPTLIGLSAADAIYDLLEGKDVQKEIKIKVELVNQDNVDDYGTERWQ